MVRTYLRTDNYADGSVTNEKLADGTVQPEDIDITKFFRFNSLRVDDTIYTPSTVSVLGNYTFSSGSVVFSGTVGFSGVNVDDIQTYSNGIVINESNLTLKPTVTGAMQITVPGGNVILNKKIRQYTTTILNVTSDVNDKIALIYCDIETIQVLIRDGVAGVDPDVPTLNDGEYALAYVYIPASASSITDNDIYLCSSACYLGKKRGRSYGVVSHGGTIPLPVAESNTFTRTAIASGDTTIDVVSTDDFKNEGHIKIDGEIISYTSKNKTQFLGCTRGIEGTIASDHNKYTAVFYTFPTSACVYTVSVNYIDGYPVWEYDKYACSANPSRVVTCYWWAPTWGGVYAYGTANYLIEGAY